MKVRIINYKKAFPRLQCGEVFRRWFYIDTFYEAIESIERSIELDK